MIPPCPGEAGARRTRETDMGTSFGPNLSGMTPEAWRVTCVGCEFGGRPDPLPRQATYGAAVGVGIENKWECPACSEAGEDYPGMLSVTPVFGPEIDRVERVHFHLSGSALALSALGVPRSDWDTGEMPAREMIDRAERVLPRLVGDTDTLRRVKALRVLARDAERLGLGVVWG